MRLTAPCSPLDRIPLKMMINPALSLPYSVVEPPETAYVLQNCSWTCLRHGPRECLATLLEPSSTCAPVCDLSPFLTPGRPPSQAGPTFSEAPTSTAGHRGLIPL